MKKLIAAVFICMIGLFAACKGKDNTETQADTTTETTEITPEATAVDTATVAPPIDNPEPGVEKSGSQEQVP